MKPEGDSAVWIPGYWNWDDERKDFLWVSGVWRVPPPGFRWMPGYWHDLQGQGYQWTSGYWMPAHLQEATFMPQPPQSIENGPTSAAPDGSHFWVAGHWQWYEGRYVWQPGYWAVQQPDWIWVPATYYWCPSGWVYVPGYWDYPLARRGVIFSPVYFTGPVAYYRPAVCLDVGVLSFSLFCRPAYCHYYFGDYYDDHYVAIGIRPWFYYNDPHRGYDPLFGYYRWYHEEHLHEGAWGRNLAGWHEYYRVHPDLRPPHTLAEQRALIASGAMARRPDARQIYTAQDIHHMDARAAARCGCSRFRRPSMRGSHKPPATRRTSSRSGSSSSGARLSGRTGRNRSKRTSAACPASSRPRCPARRRRMCERRRAGRGQCGWAPPAGASTARPRTPGLGGLPPGGRGGSSNRGSSSSGNRDHDKPHNN